MAAILADRASAYSKQGNRNAAVRDLTEALVIIRRLKSQFPEIEQYAKDEQELLRRIAELQQMPAPKP